ncbi:hypothetical protein VHEMI04199 [[Torrubiella] hemipterigena]|uniref:Calcineurin-like phosphoesterase domain-containing protein n=1 Tax=[Torrubiella] hemipterigena TaxID=1531966 RepID=A0A0A1TFR0_9HYPO|nr:hypothetical protein VHEMI04199 [[Torrubiella] hemipterigena]
MPRTKVLIISDTHGFLLPPLPAADILLHAGDLTTNSWPSEYSKTFTYIAAHPAPLKIVIPGNHDRSLDAKFTAANPYTSAARRADEVRASAEQARALGIELLLTDGLHNYTLPNGATFSIFVSPYTPHFGDWGFQYYTGKHTFDIPACDIVMTHGPPSGILDEARVAWHRFEVEHAGCEKLLEAIKRAKPQVHCFGHIHEAWGAYMAHWGTDGEVDDQQSRYLQRYAWLQPEKRKGPLTEEQKEKVDQFAKDKACVVDLADGDDKIVPGQQTLFVNAGMMDELGHLSKAPYLLDLMLPSTAKATDGQISTS